MEKHPDDLKAKVIAEHMAGASLGQLAKAYNVPKPTVQRWVGGAPRYPVSIRKETLQTYDFDKVAVELIDGSVRAFTSILHAAEDHEWIKSHSPNEAAILAGVIADKLYRLLGSLDITDERTPAELPASASEDPQQG
jgi:hypothetical protein